MVNSSEISLFVLKGFCGFIAQEDNDFHLKGLQQPKYNIYLLLHNVMTNLLNTKTLVIVATIKPRGFFCFGAVVRYFGKQWQR